MTEEKPLDEEVRRYGRRIYGAFDVHAALAKITAPLKRRSMRWTAPASQFPDNAYAKAFEPSEWDKACNQAKLDWYEATERVKEACGAKLWEEMKTAHARYLVMLNK